MQPLDSAGTAALIGALFGVGGTILGALLGWFAALSVEWGRRRAESRAALRDAIGAFLVALTDHSMALITSTDREKTSLLEYRANTAATIVTMHLKKTEAEVADLVLGAVVNASAPEKQFDRADAVRTTLRGWFRGEIPSHRVTSTFDRLLAESPTARMP